MFFPFNYNSPVKTIATVAFAICLFPCISKAELVAYWDFDTPTSTGVTVDERGGQAARMLNSAAYTPDAAGRSGTAGDRAMRFGVSNQYLQVLSDYFTGHFAGNEVTVTFWVRHNVFASSTAVSFSSTVGDRAFQAHAPWSNNTIYFDSGDNGGYDRLQVGLGATTNTWHHIALVREAGTNIKRIYRDGTEPINAAQTRTIALTITQLLIGNGPGLGQAVDGDIDEFAVFSRTLTPAEIATLSNDGPTDVDTATSLQTAVTDSDTDGIPDLWETFYLPGALTQMPAAGDGDHDDDGMTDLQESQWGFDPTVNDAGDDADGDGATNGTEVTNGTDPYDPDSDDDGLLDGVETDTGTYVSASDTGTDPLDDDSDNDGVDDGTELAYGTDPSDVSVKPTLLAWWDFDDDSNASVATDSRVGRVANFVGSAVYTADAAGQTGSTGDKGVTTNGGGLNAPAATWLNIGTDDDKLTVMFWMKWDGTIVQNSSFYINAASAERGMQSHTPWTDNNVYYDTGGTGGAGIRLNGVPSPANTWSQWHHYAFVKDGGRKTFYIDGVPKLNQASGADPLKTDFNNLHIGWNGTDQSVDGRMDDFAIFATGVSEADILSVANGSKTPAELEDADADGLPDSWEYIYFPADLSQLSTGGDKDGDGLNDEDERTRMTDPNDTDTDDDNLSDLVETGTGTWDSAADTGTNPLVADSDGDGFTDDVENNSGTYNSQADPGTDPNLADSDTDGFSDFLEGVSGYDPNDVNNFPVFTADGKFLMAYWKFDDASVPAQAVDEVNAHTGTVTGSYTAPGAGATETGTDRAICFTPGQNVQVDGAFANLASAGNKMTVSFWQKSTTALASSSFWIESVKGAGRGMQSHSPYAGGIIYFDHSGCCDIGVTRINSGDLVASGDIILGQWQHYAFVKDGNAKRVYVDGALVLSGAGTAPLVDDFAALFIGSSNVGDAIDGCIDEFAMFAGALDQDDITRLANHESADLILSPSSVYDTWASNNGLTGGNDGINDDADMDNLVNLLEFAFGTDPDLNDNNPLTVTNASTFTPGTQVANIGSPVTPENLTARFVRRKDAAAAGLTYVPEFSADLNTWETHSSPPTETVVSDAGGDYEVIDVPYHVFLADGQKATFFRIRVNSTESSNESP